MEIKPLNQLLSMLWRSLSERRRKQFFLLLILMLLASFAEILSIGSALPFLAVLTAPEQVFESKAAQPIMYLLRITSASQLLLPLTILFGFVALLAGGMRLLLLWVTTRVSFAAGTDLSIEVYRRTLYQPYMAHCLRNSSEVIASISSKTSGVISNIILPFLMLVSASIILVAILIALLCIDPLIAIVAFGGFGIIYAVIIKLTREQLLMDSRLIARESTQVIKSLQEGLGGIRDVLIDGSQEVYCAQYRQSDMKMRFAQGRSFFISGSPRFALEAMGLMLISALAYILSYESGGVAKAIPILGAIALGAQRLLPLLQQAYASWTVIRSGQASLQEVLEILDQPLPKYAYGSDLRPLSFESEIKLENLSFQYALDAPFILLGLSLKVPKGARIGVIGATGCGKSTLLDIVMGLLEPSDGQLLVDGVEIRESNRRAWQTHIAHVPQTIFLADATVEENIAFGVPKDQIDILRVRQASCQAQISETIESWPMKYQTVVGERGIRLSGGQRQRIGIARALYKKADVIIFDEATSALDGETEAAVISSVESLSEDITLFVIAHRLSTLKGCTHIIELDCGAIKRAGSYQEIIARAGADEN